MLPPNIYFHFRSLVTLLISLTIQSATLSANPKLENRVTPKKRAQLERINLANVSHVNSSIIECLNFIRSRCRELDNTTLDPKLKGVSIVIIPPPSAPKRELLVTYKAHNVSVNTALIEIAKQTKLDLYITSVGIVFCPPGTPPFPNKLAQKGDIWDILHTQAEVFHQKK